MRSLEDILQALVQATGHRKITWETHGGRYTTKLPGGYSVAVWTWTDRDTDGDGVTAELRKDGEIIDAVKADRFGRLYVDLTSLSDAARRSANNVDAAIGELTALLSSMGAMR